MEACLKFSCGDESGIQGWMIRTLLICLTARSVGDLRLSAMALYKHREWSATFFLSTVLRQRL
jgi:hypothetical protein